MFRIFLQVAIEVKSFVIRRRYSAVSIQTFRIFDPNFVNFGKNMFKL